MATKRSLGSDGSSGQPAAKVASFSGRNSLPPPVFERVYAAILKDDGKRVNVFEIVATSTSAVVRIQLYSKTKFNLKIDSVGRLSAGISFSTKMFKTILSASKYLTESASVVTSNGEHYYEVDADGVTLKIRKMRVEDQSEVCYVLLAGEEMEKLRKECQALRILVDTYEKFKPSSVAYDLSVVFARTLRDSFQEQNKEETSNLFKVRNPLQNGNTLYKLQDIYITRILGIPKEIIPPAEFVAKANREGGKGDLSWEESALPPPEGYTNPQQVAILAFAANVEAFQKKNAKLHGYMVDFVSMPVYKQFLV